MSVSVRFNLLLKQQKRQRDYDHRNFVKDAQKQVFILHIPSLQPPSSELPPPRLLSVLMFTLSACAIN